MVNYLKGKKTYIVAFGMVVYAVLVLGVGHNDWVGAWQLTLQAAGLAGLRAGVSKAAGSV